MYKKIVSKPLLTLKSPLVRRDWATQYQYLNRHDWYSIVFSDEKKFSLHGPDGNQYYWKGSRDESRYKTKRHSGGGKLMVWAAFCATGKSNLHFSTDNQTAQDYAKTMTQSLLPFVNTHFNE